jgi:hypothetical protein
MERSMADPYRGVKVGDRYYHRVMEQPFGGTATKLAKP